VVLFIALLCAQVLAEDAAGSSITVVIGGRVVNGEAVLPATEKQFQLKINGATLAFGWDQLDPSERARVQKLLGLSPDGPKKAFGKPMNGVRYTLKSGKTVTGLPVRERDRAGQKALKTLTGVTYVLESEIADKEDFAGRESDFFSPLEIYERMMAENAPGAQDASAHLEMARKAEELELYDKALKHLDAAELVDARVAERNKEQRQSLATRLTDKQTRELYGRMMRERANGNFASALELLEQLDRMFPNSELRSRWQALRPEIEAKARSAPAKQVVQMAYQVADQMLQRRLASKARIDKDGNLVPAVPGKQITTRHGKVFRGVLEREEDDTLTLQTGDTHLQIPRRDIALIQDIDLSVAAREIDRGLDDLKSYIMDQGPAGLKGQTIAQIAAMLKLQPNRVKEFFDNRLHKESTYEDGVVTSTPVYATRHTASYGQGSWLRDGARFTPYQEAAQTTASRSDTAQARAEDTDTDPAKTDDPEVWWKHQTPETRLNILRAFMAEKAFSVKSVDGQTCKECGGSGTLPMRLDKAETPGRCPCCRGMKTLTRIVYE
jgi:tetratricopeptide (TPR) repeat protein